MPGFRVAGLVLIAEDDPHIAHLLERCLARDGFATGVTGTGREALAACVREAPSLVVLDRMLPEVDGWEVCLMVVGLVRLAVWVTVDSLAADCLPP